MKNSTKEISNISRVISLAIAIVMIFALATLNSGGAAADQTSNDDVDASILTSEPGETALEENVETGESPAVPGLPEEPRGDSGTDAEEPGNEATGAAINGDGEESSVTDSNIVAENGSASNEAAGNEASGSEASGNDASGGDSSGNEAAGNEAAGHESSEDESAENETAGDEFSENKDDEDGGDRSEAPEEIAPPAPNSISGFFWVDGNGDLDTDWDGLYNGDEQPLQDYPVSLYRADDLSSAVADTTTDAHGRYVFEDLEPGSYVLEIWGTNVWGIDYLAPVFITSDNKFAIDWSVPGIPAYTEEIELADEQSVQDVNAGLRLPMGIARYASYGPGDSLSNLKNANKNDTFEIAGRTWVVVKTQDILGVRYVYLILRGSSYSNLSFGSSRDYTTSRLRQGMNDWLADPQSHMQIIHALAVKPYLETYSLKTARTLLYDPLLFTYLNPNPVPEMAWPETWDVLFAPSYQDLSDWVGNEYTIPSGHPLHHNAQQKFPQRFWSRTPYSTTNQLYGYIYSTSNTLDAGLQYTGTTISDVPGVWVNSGAVSRKVEVYHIDTAGNPIGDPNPDIYTVSLNETYGTSSSNIKFTLQNSHIQEIEGFEYKRWRVGLNGQENETSFPVDALDETGVVAGTPIYLIYDNKTADFTVTKTVENENNKSKEFTFNVEFQDNSGNPLTPGLEFTLVGGTISGSEATAPSGGIYALNSNGALTFTLKNGQTMKIKSVPLGSKIIVSENSEYRYEASYSIDGGTVYEGTTTSPISIGNNSVTVDFVNTRQIVIPTGITSDPWVVVAYAMVAIALIAAGPAAVRLIKRRTAASSSK